MQLTAVHWVYAGTVLIVIVTMAMRRDALIPCIAGVFIVGWIMTGTPLGGIETIFKASVVAARELLDIILVVSIIVGLAAALERMGAEYLMIAPARKLMKSPQMAFWVLGLVMLFASYFLWPSPATALVGAVLVPAATAAKLPAISAAVAMNIFGHGIALSTDYIIQGAPNISAKAANVPVAEVMRNGVPLIVTMGVVTVAVSFFIARRDIARLAAKENLESGSLSDGPDRQPEGTETADASVTGELALIPPPIPTTIARVAAVVVPLSYVFVVVAMIVFRIRGGEATAMIGGVTLLLLTSFTLLADGWKGFDLITDHLVKGFSFGIRIFAPVIFIASFFYLGAPEIAKQVFGEGATGMLFDLAGALSNVLPLNRVSVGLMETLIGVMVGLDGSGFSGLPLTGSMAGAFAAAAHLNAATIAALGQIAAVWVGGGCVIPWGVVAVAAICRISPQELARKNFIPVLAGLLATTIVAIILI